MKPKIDDKRCGASESACKVIKVCPTDAISYIEAAEPITDRNVVCNSGSGCGCNCDCGSGSGNCGGSLYGRIVIDYDKCIECGVCADECCGTAIEMVESL